MTSASSPSGPGTCQIFSLFHELAHLLFRTSGVDSLGDEYVERLSGRSAAVEVFCNLFAARFLLPEAELAAALHGQQPSEDLAQTIAARFKVSREAVQEKLSELAASYSNPEEVRRAYLQNADMMRQIEAQVLEAQAIDWVLSQAKVTDKPATFADLTQFGQTQA